MLEQESVHTGPAVQRLAVEQGRVPLWMGDQLGRRRKHDLLEAPDSGARRAPTPAIGKPAQQIRPRRPQRPVIYLEQPAAPRAPRVGIGLGHFVPARNADLPGLRPIGGVGHDTILPPSWSTCATRTRALMPASAYATCIAAATACALSSPRASANAVGPLPEIDAPSAPAWSAACFPAANPGSRQARAGSAIRSSSARPNNS